jgi:uncharacterized protein YdcH (DUF465 family)
MFEHRQQVMEKLMKEDEDFRRIFNRHQELDKRVTAAELGTAPMEDLALNQLKKEKLWAKDRTKFKSEPGDGRYITGRFFLQDRIPRPPTDPPGLFGPGAGLNRMALHGCL